MNKKKITFIVFIVVVLVQLYVPATMVFHSESVLATGKEYKFETAPIDPNDPFRGKYITLRYKESTIKVQDENNWQKNEPVYVSLITDLEGFAKVLSISKYKPENEDFLRAEVNSVSFGGFNTITIKYPFERYYMEESKAYKAELAYRKSLFDSTKTTYALVHIKDGEAVLKDVLINEISIKEIVEEDEN